MRHSSLPLHACRYSPAGMTAHMYPLSPSFFLTLSVSLSSLPLIRDAHLAVDTHGGIQPTVEVRTHHLRSLFSSSHASTIAREQRRPLGRGIQPTVEVEAHHLRSLFSSSHASTIATTSAISTPRAIDTQYCCDSPCVCVVSGFLSVWLFFSCCCLGLRLLQG